MTEDHDYVPPWTFAAPHFWSIDYIRARREKVFAYLTEGTHTRTYYFGMGIRDPSGVGDPIWFGPSEEESPIIGEVTGWDPPAYFAHTFSFGHLAEEPPSTVEFFLYDDGPELTGLYTRHHGFESRDSETYHDICSGWPKILSGLKTVLETGTALEFPEPPPEEMGDAD